MADLTSFETLPTRAAESGSASLIPSTSSAQNRLRPTLPEALTRHGLNGDWDTLMAEIERRGWYIVPINVPSGRGEERQQPRRVFLGMTSNESHVTIDGTGATIVEAIGWAMVHALDASPTTYDI